MTLAFSAAHLIWQPGERAPDSEPADEEQNAALRSFVDALYRSQGSDEAASGEQIDEWINAGHHSFFMMLKPLLAKPELRAALSSVNMVVLAHWTPDTLIGQSTTNAVLHEIQAENAFGIAVSDHGLSASWFALSLIDDYLSDNGGIQTALLLFADQNTSLHRSEYLKNIAATPCAGALLLEKMPSGVDSRAAHSVTFSGYDKILKSVAFSYRELQTASEALFSAPDRQLPLVMITSGELAAELRNAPLADNTRLQVWDDSLLSVAPWALLKTSLASGRRYLFVQQENESLVFAAFVSGGSPCI